MSKYELPFDIDMAWCPGCGNFQIRKSIISALDELSQVHQTDVVFVSGIGQAAKMPQYLNVNYFNGLHGRALPVALAVKAANPSLTVIAEGGDGDMYGEGGNHFLHNIRRNIDITHIVHNNMVYGLTKDLIKMAVNHKGYAMIDLLHPCVSFNKINTFKWYEENTYKIETHDETNRSKAWELAIKPGKLGLGVYYKKEGGKTFTDSLSCYQKDTSPLYKRKWNQKKLTELIHSRI